VEGNREGFKKECGLKHVLNVDGRNVPVEKKKEKDKGLRGGENVGRTTRATQNPLGVGRILEPSRE